MKIDDAILTLQHKMVEEGNVEVHVVVTRKDSGKVLILDVAQHVADVLIRMFR